MLPDRNKSTLLKVFYCNEDLSTHYIFSFLCIKTPLNLIDTTIIYIGNRLKYDEKKRG